MNKEPAILWIDALTSRKYTQGQGFLKRENEGTFCCLGVLCEIAIEQGVIVEKRQCQWEEESFALMYDGETTEPPLPVCDWAGITDSQVRYLIECNDTKGYTFSDIAKVVEGMIA